MSLEDLRQQIDSIDREIVERLNRRVLLASEIGNIKAESGAGMYVPVREEEVFRKLEQLQVDGPLDSRAIRAIYREIISASIALEKPLVIGYLGPEATYTQQAALKNFGSSVEYRPYNNIADVFHQVEKGDADYGVVPVENSTEGAVFHSLDMLAETDLKITAQVYLPIEHCLLSSAPLEEITEVHSKDQALGQCRKWLRTNLPNATIVECSSTARAVEIARDKPRIAAIASSLAGELYDVPVIQRNIQDRAENITRFLVIARASGPAGNGDVPQRTSIVFSLKDRIGALQSALEPFSKRDVNLCKIESRPSRRKPWDYYFFIDCLGHFDDSLVQQSFAELESMCSVAKWLGSYPDVR
ncbi:MAG: prephenate dehydratase [Opitutae bacterium]